MSCTDTQQICYYFQVAVKNISPPDHQEALVVLRQGSRDPSRLHYISLSLKISGQTPSQDAAETRTEVGVEGEITAKQKGVSRFRKKKSDDSIVLLLLPSLNLVNVVVDV